MDKRARLFHGGWYRFDGYEVRDGYIQPKADAKLEPVYDIWAEWERPRWAQRRKAPHESFMALWRADAVPYINTAEWNEVEACGGRPQLRCRPAVEERVLSWCCQYGLPGLLLERANRIVLPVCWQPSRQPDTLLPLRTIYSVIPGGWEEREQLVTGAFWSVKDEATKPKRMAGDLVPEANLAQGIEPSGVLIQRWTDRQWRRERFNESWQAFFPSIATDRLETYSYPIPGSDEFWRIYAEPVAHVIQAARDLKETALLLAGEDMYGDGSNAKRNIARGATRLEHMVQTARLGLWTNDAGAHVPVWLCASLSGYMALMLYRDITEGKRRVARCPARACGEPFLTSAWQQEYCGPTCRNRELKRRYRVNLAIKAARVPMAATQTPRAHATS